MKKLLNKITDMLADAALLEMGVHVATPVARAMGETLEENLIEVAFAEEADYDDIHKTILREHQKEWNISHPVECQYGKTDIRFRHAA